MRIYVTILLSVVGYSIAERLQVKCGDELCERPSNRAVTTLRYTPDKPYKLQINSVNSEVEIFGATDDLFYIRYGRNFGFLPKNHLREKARGNFLHSVEIDIASLKINQEVRETNYLHELIKSSSSSPSSHSHEEPDKNTNDSRNETAEQVRVNQSETVNVPDGAILAQEERPTDYIPIGTEPKIDQQSATQPEEQKLPPPPPSEEENDSGVEEEEEEDEEEGGEYEEDEEGEIFDKPNPNNETTTEPATADSQPELQAIPPVVEEVPAAGGSLPEQPHEKQQDAVEQKVEQADSPEPAMEQEVKIENTGENKEENVKPKEEEVKTEEISPPPLPAPVTEEVVEDSHHGHHHHHHHHQHEEKVEVNTETPKIEEAVENSSEMPRPETTVEMQQHEATTETPNIESTTVQEVATDSAPATDSQEFMKLPEMTTPQPTPIVEEPIAQEHFATPPPEIPTMAPEIEIMAPDREENVEELPQLKEKHEHKFQQDMLLKRFDEKLGSRGSSEGVGSVKQVHPNQGHEGHSHTHDMHHQHQQQQQPPPHDHIHSETEPPPSTIDQIAENDQKPGFFDGLVKKFFGDGNEAGQENEAKSTDSIDEGFCEKIDSENCPKSLKSVKRQVVAEGAQSKWMSSDEYISLAMHEAIERMDLIISMALVALTVLIFTFGYYCINKVRREGPLIAKMNELERHLMASVKENEMLKGEVVVTKQKLVSIEDNSFGSNDMVIALKGDLESSERDKLELQEKISALEKELEAAAEDGLELNRMVSELLNNQTGSDSIISSVEDLQRQLNEQQETIVTMNETLAQKSRENTELQIQLTEINGKCSGELEKSQQNLDAVILERNNLQIELENLKRESDLQVNQIIEERNGEVTRLNSELTSYAGKYDEAKKILNGAEAKVQALEECIETFKKHKGGSGDLKALLDVADLKADLLAVTKEKSTIQEQLQTERDSRKLLEDRVKTVSEEMSNLKKEFVTADKEKLEAQTRLEVLSTYFKEKETQLQQELSVKEARWMKQQGEKTSTVEKIQALNDEIQALKSQNDALRAEIEAQAAAHKLNISTTETQAHTAWLNARQAERKLEESRMEAAALRRRLTSIAENPSGASDLLNGLPGTTNDSMNSIPSPIRVESPNNVNQMPPGPPLMMPPPFLPGAPPFLPPFLPPPGEMPMGMMPPLGRLMSPPPKRFTPTMRDDRDRYSPRGGGRRYSPDSRYDDDDYTAFETETDYSPPRTPTPTRRGYTSPSDRSKKSKGGHNSDSIQPPMRRK